MLATGALGCAGAAMNGCARLGGGTISAGNVNDLQVGTLQAVSGEGVAIGRDERGVYALSLICTHEGCDMSVAGSVSYGGGIRCACHGAEFDREGNVESGPARTALEHYAVSVDASGAITIDTSTLAETSARSTVPAV